MILVEGYRFILLKIWLFFDFFGLAAAKESDRMAACFIMTLLECTNYKTLLLYKKLDLPQWFDIMVIVSVLILNYRVIKNIEDVNEVKKIVAEKSKSFRIINRFVFVVYCAATFVLVYYVLK